MKHEYRLTTTTLLSILNRKTQRQNTGKYDPKSDIINQKTIH